mgnify:CR=1 FL=1
MSYDELELDTLGDRKTALFLIMSDTDDTFNFVVSILYTQLFQQLFEQRRQLWQQLRFVQQLQLWQQLQLFWHNYG